MMDNNFSINSRIEEDSLIISLVGHIDSSNASTFEKEIFELINSNKDKKPSLDGQFLSYISSAGLRVILKIIKYYDQKISFINVNDDIYNILQITAFTDLMDVRKAMRSIDISGCECIGRGSSGVVYRLGNDEIIKVYSKNSTLQDIENERNRAKNAFLTGVPTAISYDIVRVGEGYGAVFEMMKSNTLSSYLNQNIEKYAYEYGKFIKGLHSIKVDTSKFMSMKEIYKGFAYGCKDRYTQEELNKIVEFIGNVPETDTFVHCDCHQANVMVQDGELMLIDMADIGYGNPLFDLGAMYNFMKVMVVNRTQFVENLFNMKQDKIKITWNLFIRSYLDTDDEETIKKFEDKVKIFAGLHMAIGAAIAKNAPEEFKQWMVGEAKKNFLPFIDGYMQDM